MTYVPSIAWYIIAELLKKPPKYSPYTFFIGEPLFSSLQRYVHVNMIYPEYLRIGDIYTAATRKQIISILFAQIDLSFHGKVSEAPLPKKD